MKPNALDAERISRYATPSEDDFKHIKLKARKHLDAGGPVNRLPHANQLWMLAGFRLFEGLSGIAECIEVYPHATVRALGAGTTYKAKSGGAWAQLLAASRFTGWPSDSPSAPSASAISWGQLHDRVDAYLAAWVAVLPIEERRALGTPPDDVIWIPRLEGVERSLPPALTNEVARRAAPPTPTESPAPVVTPWSSNAGRGGGTPTPPLRAWACRAPTRNRGSRNTEADLPGSSDTSQTIIVQPPPDP